MKLGKFIAAVATIAIVSEVTRRIVEEIEYRRINEELFGREEEDEIVFNYSGKKVETLFERLEKERKQMIKALRVEQDYHLATIQYAIYEMDEPDVVKEAKARLIEIHKELEALK